MGLTAGILESLTKTMTQDTSFASGAVPWVSLHSADPGGTGAHEVTSGTSIYGRQVATFAGSDGIDTLSVPLSIVLADATVTWIGYWTAQTGGTFLGGFPLIGAGTIAVGLAGAPSLTAPVHGLSITNIVRLFPMPGPAASAIPAGFSADTQYWVVAAPDANHVSLAASLGGTPITPSSAGAFGMYLDEGEYGASGTLTFPASTGITYATAS